MVLIAGSALSPEFDVFFHAYIGVITGMSSLLIIIAITVRVMCPRQLASAKIQVNPCVLALLTRVEQRRSQHRGYRGEV